MKHSLHVLAVFLVIAAPHATASSIKELLEEAVDAPQGTVYAPIDGQVTDMIRRAAPIQGDVMAHITTIKRFKEEGCRRFRIELKARFAPESGHAGPIPLPQMEMNYCKGGFYPQEGVDPAAGERFMEQVDEYAKARGLAAPPRPQPPAYMPPWVSAVDSVTDAVPAPAAAAAPVAPATTADPVARQPKPDLPTASAPKKSAAKKPGGKPASTKPSTKPAP